MKKFIHAFVTHSFIHSAVCLETGPYPPPKRILHRMRCSVSSFNLHYRLSLPYGHPLAAHFFKYMSSNIK